MFNTMFNVFVVLFFLHWFADFVFQSRWMANNKSRNPWALLAHVSVYSLIMFVGLLNPWLTFADKIKGEGLLWFVGVNFALHFATDLITSQITKYFWQKGDTHKFFVTIGFDQFVHQLCLMVTAQAYLLS